MPVYKLFRELIFPLPEQAEPNGLLAVGGDLTVKRLLLAYSLGIFPWYSQGDPILRWSPDPRLVLEPDKIKISKSFERVLKKTLFAVTMDQAFEQVIRSCATAKRKGEQGTWITADMIRAYVRLHAAGFAHSVEVWCQGRLAGGLYGVALGRAFFGESMFANARDASKVALVGLARALRIWGYDFIDCQTTSEHLLRMGACAWPRAEFLQRLEQALRHPTQAGPWTMVGETGSTPGP